MLEAVLGGPVQGGTAIAEVKLARLLQQTTPELAARLRRRRAWRVGRRGACAADLSMPLLMPNEIRPHTLHHGAANHDPQVNTWTAGARATERGLRNHATTLRVLEPSGFKIREGMVALDKAGGLPRAHGTSKGDAVTLADAVAPAAISAETLHRRHGPLLGLVRVLIGVVPNCDAYLEIWPPGFRSYNVMVPNLLNVPAVLLRQPRFKQALGLAMYAASRAAGCAYCSAHTCAFALRRGASAGRIAGSTPGISGTSMLSPADRAATRAAEAIARVPSTFDRFHQRDLQRHFSPTQVEWLLLGVAMMGFLNKFMDAMGIPLERPTVNEVEPVIGRAGWTPGQHPVMAAHLTGHPHPPQPDSARTAFGMLPHLPAALVRDRRWTSGVPTTWPAIGTYLHQHTGHGFPILAGLTQRRAIRALATIIRDNCDPARTSLGLRAKHLAGLVYAETVGDPALTRATESITQRCAPPVSAPLLEAVARFARAPVDLADPSAIQRAEAATALGTSLNSDEVAALLLAKAASPSPASVTQPIIAQVTQQLDPPAIVELLTWLSVQQAVHRLHVSVPSLRGASR